MALYTTPAWINGASPAISAANLLAMGYAIEETQHPYAPCGTAAGTAAKTATISNISNPSFSTFLGLHIIVRFQYANTAANPTLNVNSTGDLPIYKYGSVRLDTWKAGQFFTLVYRSSAWYVAGTCDPDDKAKVETGSYTGTGTSGQDNPNTLSLGISPKFIMIFDPTAGANNHAYTMFLIPGHNGTVFWAATDRDSYSNVAGANTLNIRCTVSGNTVSWYSALYNGSTSQMNKQGVTYYWVAIG